MIAEIVQDLEHRRKTLPPVVNLTFLNRPRPEDPQALPTASHDPNALDPLALSFNDPVNTPVIDYELWLGQQIDRLESMQFRASDHVAERARGIAVESLSQEFGRIQQEKLKVWTAQQRLLQQNQVLDAIDLEIRKPRDATIQNTCELTPPPFINLSHQDFSPLHVLLCNEPWI